MLVEVDSAQLLFFLDIVERGRIHGFLYLNITELESERIMITVSATDAYDYYVTKGKSPQNNLVNWDNVLKQYYIFDGIQFEINQPYYDYKNNYISSDYFN